MEKNSSIDNILLQLDEIIEECKSDNDPLGYFAALYRKVTAKIKEGIATGYFDDGVRMEQLDIVFANRYLEAYSAYQKQKAVTQSWTKAFELGKLYKAVVLQHLLIGMNAHINLDLGIAAAEVSVGHPIGNLYSDFCKINDILSSLVEETQNGISSIWPALKWILGKSGKLDNYIVDFSMKLAREGAWKFATQLAAAPHQSWSELILERDVIIARKSEIITKPGFWLDLGLIFVRITERGSVADKITQLSIRKS